jgi:putative ABC transport system permease protein
LDTFLRGFRVATRGLMRTPGVSVIAVVALALGIGFTAVMFSIVYGVLYRGLPMDDGDRIVALSRSEPDRGIFFNSVPIHDFLDWRERQDPFQDIAAYTLGTVNVRAGERPERYTGGFITANTLDVLRVEPILGRGFTAEEDQPGAPPALLLGYRVWREDFGADSTVLGRGVTVNGETGVIVGVMPEGFLFPELQEVWLPMRPNPGATPRGQGAQVTVLGRLKDGVTIEEAEARMAPVASALASEYPESNAGAVAEVRRFTEGSLGEEERATLLAMLATSGLVLLVACANVANLLLARAASRTRDVAVRVAMGATRARVIATVLAESLVLGVAGAALGSFFAWVGIGMFRSAVLETDIPYWMKFQLDGPILAFVALAAAAAALVSGIIPALRVSTADLNAVLKDESRGSSSLRIGKLSRALVMVEVAMSMAILVSSGLMIQTVLKLKNLELPYPSTNVFTARMGIFESASADPIAGNAPEAIDARERFWQDVEARVAALPGVHAAGIGTQLPGVGAGGNNITIDGNEYPRDEDVPVSGVITVSPGYFATFETTVLEGRLFNDLDRRENAKVAVVNETFVREILNGEPALGKRVRLGGRESTGPWREIVGVVPDQGFQQVGDTDPGSNAGMYLPLTQEDARFLSIVARTDGDPLAIAEDVRTQVAAADANTPIYFVDTLRNRIDEEVWFYPVFGSLFAAFGLGALFMASVGLYGVMSFSVRKRTLEMGIRMALGAERSQVRRLVIGQGMWQVGIGALAGVGLALLVASGLKIFFAGLGVKTYDPMTYVLVATVLGLTGLIASAIPAARATRVDPSKALRNE